MRSPAGLIELVTGIILTGAFSTFILESGWVVAGTACAVYAIVAAAVGIALPGHRMGWANRVTLLRATIVCVLAGSLLRPAIFTEQAGPIIALVFTALILDGIDGWLARRLGEVSRLGARFDMETDAALILVLCLGLWLAGIAPAWVLAIGMMRPAFVAAGTVWPWLSRPLPDQFRRRLICVIQVGALPLALLPALPESLRVIMLFGALLALSASFAVDIAWLFHHRKTSEYPEWRNP